MTKAEMLGVLSKMGCQKIFKPFEIEEREGLIGLTTKKPAKVTDGWLRYICLR